MYARLSPPTCTSCHEQHTSHGVPPALLRRLCRLLGGQEHDVRADVITEEVELRLARFTQEKNELVLGAHL